MLFRWHFLFVCLLVSVAFLMLPVPLVHALESVVIKELHYPSEIVVYKSGAVLVKDSQAPAIVWVNATVSYAGISYQSGNRLDVGMVETSTYGSNPAKGSCRILGQPDSSCVDIPVKGSGTKYFHFELDPPVGTQAEYWNLTLHADVHTPKGKVLCEDHQDLTIIVTREVQLTVSAPDQMTINGTSYSRSAVFSVLTRVPSELSVPDLLQFDNGTRLRFSHWTDGSTATDRTVALTEDAKFEAIYVTQYLLTLVNPTWGNGTRTGWYDRDSVAQLQALPIQPMSGLLGMLGCKWEFRGWYEYANLLASVPMDRPHALTARYQADYRPLVIVLMAVALASCLLVVVAVNDPRGKLERARSALQARLSSTRRRRGATVFVVRILLTIVLVFISLSRTIITVILGRKEAGIITWRETQRSWSAGETAIVIVEETQVSGILDPVTGTGFDDGELAWKCANCQMFYHDPTHSFLREQNSGRCVGCGQSRLERSRIGVGKAVSITERPVITERPEFRPERPRPQIAFEPSVVTLGEISQYVGQIVFFQGRVVEVAKSRATGAYCVKFQRGTWPRVFKLVIFRNYVDNFRFGGQTIEGYEDRTIRVRGLIQRHPEWGLEILVYNESVITVVG